MLSARANRLRRQLKKPLDFNPYRTSNSWNYPVRSTDMGFKAGLAIQGPFDGSAYANAAAVFIGVTGFIDTYFNRYFDAAQGSIVFEYIPELDGNDGVERYFFNSNLNAASTTFQLKKKTDNKLSLSIAGVERVNVDVSGWTLGTRYSIVLRWDAKIPLDGTNHACISINDSHTFGGAASWTPVVPGAFGIGYLPPIAGSSDKKSMNGIISGLTFYRRPLFDGTYGIDAGNGDEIAAIYNAGSGLDCCIATKGSWDVCLCWPITPTVGTLSYQFSWAHPYSGNAITDGFCQTTYGSSAWGDEGTPSSGPSDITAAQRIFWRGYEWTCDAVDEGITQTVSGASAGQNYVVRVLAHCTSADDVRVRIWDETNGAQIGTDFDFGASSSRTVPGVAILTFELPTIARNGAASDCTSWSIKILGTANGQTVYLHQVEVLANLIDNPSLETGAGDPWIPSGWTNVNLDAGDTVQELVTVHSGNAALKWATTAIAGELLGQNVTASLGTHIAVGAAINNADLSFGGRDTSHVQHHSDGDSWIFWSTAVGWNFVGGVVVCIRNTPQVAQVPASFVVWDRFSDDIYAIQLNNGYFGYLSVYGIPDSLEGEFLRIDDGEYATFNIPFLQAGARQGIVRWKWKQRHAPADVLKFGITAPRILTLYGNASHYVILEWSAANTVRLRFNDGGVEHSGTWDATGAFAVLDELDGIIEFDKLGIRLVVDGLERIVINEEPTFDVPLTLLYIGSDNVGASQCDALFGLP